MASTGTAEKSANAEKTAAVAEIAAAFRGATAALLTEYRGLTVGELSTLRRALGAGTTYAVVKNTLTKIAAADAGLTGLDGMLAGPTAIAFVTGDPVEAAKGLRDFARDHPLLVVKGGILDGRPLSPDEIARLADLESREVLLSKLAGALKGSLSQAVGLFAAPLAQVARLAAALEAKAQADPSILRGGVGTSEETSAAAPTEETTATPSSEAAPAEVPSETSSETPPETTSETPAESPAAETPAAETPAETPEQVVAEAEAPQPDPAADEAAPDSPAE